MTDEEMRRFLELSLSLSRERDREELLSSILDTAMDLTRCDAGTLYLAGDDGLHFCRMESRSRGIRQGGHADRISLPPVPMDPSYVCAWCAINRQSVNVSDAASDPRFDFSGSRLYDGMTGYSTRTMLVVPMLSGNGELLGVTQLINAQDRDGNIIPFRPEYELLVGAITSQAAISITNMRYSEQITGLLDSLVGALSAAIDQRTPYNANHTRNMVLYASRFLRWLEETGHPWSFPQDKRRTFLLAVWLHDVGKLAVPLEGMDKDTRLGSALDGVLQRLRTAALLDRISLLEGRITQEEYSSRQDLLRAAREDVSRINTAGLLRDCDVDTVRRLASFTYVDEDGAAQPLLTPAQTECLTIRKGTLTQRERSVMEGHVTDTARILGRVVFPKMYSQVPKWAASHHEYLSGCGYPDQLKGDEIPPEVRLLTILDVFDALTARDRPYKQHMPPSGALGVLRDMASDGDIDSKILSLFEESKAWEEIV